ncbi:MAG TPA: hypothetical protein VGC19_00830 [Rhodanobacter sp.]
MTASEIAAWWGAVIATAVFAWDIFKWLQSGVRLKVRAIPNMQIAGDSSEKKLVLVEVVNRGDKATTITHWALYEFASTFNRLRRKRKAQGLVPHPDGPTLPYELAPGQRRAATVVQAGVLTHFSDGQIFCAIIHTGSDREALCRLNLLP